MFCYAWFYLHRSLVIYDIGYFEQFKIWLHKGYNDGNLDAATESELCSFLVKLPTSELPVKPSADLNGDKIGLKPM